MWWFQKLPKHLPFTTGPFIPGCIDAMIGYTATSQLIRIYYPSNCMKNETNDYKKWIPWLPHKKYLNGFANVLMVPVYLLKLLFWWVGSTHIPVLYGENLIDNKKRLKCIVLSHGMGGCRFMYSSICSDLASQGFVVCAIEHKDLSSCYTYHYNSKENAINDCRKDMEFLHVPFGGIHYKERNQQIHFRTKECSRIVDFLIGLNRGNVPENVLDFVPTERKTKCKLEHFIDRLDLEDLIMMGHSFGGATALNTISVRKEFKYCILLDPWMFPIKDEELCKKVQQPILFINTQTFHIESNVKAMAKFLTNDARSMYTIRHTTHESQTDSPFVVGYWLNWFMKKLDPEVARNINNALIFSFLHDFIKYPVNINEFLEFLNKQKENIECGLTKPWA